MAFYRGYDQYKFRNSCHMAQLNPGISVLLFPFGHKMLKLRFLCLRLECIFKIVPAIKTMIFFSN